MNTKKIISLAATLLITLSSVAQIPPIILGDSHVMLRMSKDARYVLLPVQEAEDIASIAVLNDRNDMVQRINVKLAVDRVDYWVPYELKAPASWTSSFMATADRRALWASSFAGKRLSSLTPSIPPTASASVLPTIIPRSMDG